jgi:hypothetical protein
VLVLVLLLLLSWTLLPVMVAMATGGPPRSSSRRSATCFSAPATSLRAARSASAADAAETLPSTTKCVTKRAALVLPVPVLALVLTRV